jgi:hypothetical protein
MKHFIRVFVKFNFVESNIAILNLLNKAFIIYIIFPCDIVKDIDILKSLQRRYKGFHIINTLNGSNFDFEIVSISQNQITLLKTK